MNQIARLIIRMILFMVIMAFWSPILYDLFCKKTGFNGTTQRGNLSSNMKFKYYKKWGPDAQNKHIDLITDAYKQKLELHTSEFINSGNSISFFPNLDQAKNSQKESINSQRKSIRVEFDSNVHSKLNWKFYPKTQFIDVYPGQTFLVYFYIKNISGRDKVGTAIYNVSPVQAGQYFIKIQCFCFENIFLKNKEEVTVPVLFHIDEDIAANKETKDIRLMTLSYTFFPSIMDR